MRPRWLDCAGGHEEGICHHFSQGTKLFTTFHNGLNFLPLFTRYQAFRYHVKNTLDQKSEVIVFRLMLEAWTLFGLRARTSKSFTLDLGKRLFSKKRIQNFIPIKFELKKKWYDLSKKRLTGNLYAPPVGLQLVQTPLFISLDPNFYQIDQIAYIYFLKQKLLAW